MNKIWYRNTTWNEEIENSFFKKLGRVKDKSMRAQYLKLQAGSLAYTKAPALMDVAEKLLNKQLTEYSDVVLFVSSAYGLLGDIQGFKGIYNQAIDLYKKAIDFEATYPNYISPSFMDYAELVIKTKRTDLYDDVEKIFSEKRYDSASSFPFALYKKYSILSIISKYKKDMEKAKYYADLAEENAQKQETGLNNHQTLGLVTKRDEILDEMVRK